MTTKQLNQLSSERVRLAQAFRSLLSSRNTIIDSFQNEYLRHVKLTAKKPEARKALLDSLSRSRNMKKIQKEFLDNKARLKENQKESKLIKMTYQQANCIYQIEIAERRANDNPTPKCYA